MVLLLDEIDISILQFLEKDVDIPYKKIAKSLGVSLTTVYNRVKNLEKNNIIEKKVAKINYKKLGFALEALVGISVNPKYSAIIVAELKKIDSVQAIFDITGRYDYFIQIRVRNTEELQSLLSEKMGEINGVQTTETFIIVKSIEIK